MIRWNTLDFAWDGTSLTNRRVSGYWLDDLEARLRLVSNRSLRFYDLGTPGGQLSTTGSTQEAILKIRPAAVVIEYAMNEAAAKIDLAAYRSLLEGRIDAYRAGITGVQILLMTMNPAVAPSVADNVREYYSAMRRVAASRGVPVIDNEPVWGVPTLAQIPDRIHPTRAANLAVTVPTALAALTTYVQD